MKVGYRAGVLLFLLLVNSAARAAPADDAAQVERQWSTAFASRDLNRLASLYTPDATVFGGQPELFQGQSGVRRYFDRLSRGMFTSATFSEREVVQLAPNVIVSVGRLTLTKEANGQVSQVPLQLSLVLIQIGNQWKIASHHVSPSDVFLPPPPAPERNVTVIVSQTQSQNQAQDQRSPSQQSSTPATPSTKAAWVYYEVGKDSRPTADGKLETLPSGTPLPDFIGVKRGITLRALSPVNLRDRPPDTWEEIKQRPPIATLLRGDCVVTVSDADPNQEIPTQIARSGGWLQVSVRPCSGS